MNFLALILATLAASKETIVSIEGEPTLEKWNAILEEHDVVVAGYSYCFFAKKSIAKLNDVKLDYAWLKMDKQEASSGVMFNFMKENYGYGKINVFINGQAGYTTELALNKVENDEIIAKYVSGN